MPTDNETPLLDQLYAKRAADVEKWSALITKRETERSTFETRSSGEDDKPTETEVEAEKVSESTFVGDAEQLKASILDFDRRIDDQLEMVKRRDEAAAASTGPAHVTGEPMTYERHKAIGETGVSYYRDLAQVLVPGIQFGSTDLGQSHARLNQHAKELRVEMPKRQAAQASRAKAQFEDAEARGGERRALPFDPFRRGRVPNSYEQRVEPNSTDGQGGYFIPPLWLEDDYIPGLRAHLVAAGLARQMDLPEGTNSINIPKLANLTTVGYQQANNAGLPSTDWSDTAVQANVKTIGGYSDVALQLLEQSPHQIVDEVVTTDLMAARNKFLDQQFLAGDGLNTAQLNGGHLQGLYPVNNWGANGVTFTASSPAPYLFPQVLGAMTSQIARTRFDAQNLKIIMSGRRWFWYSTGLDGNDRPLGETISGGRFNVSAALESGLQAEGLVGTLPFLSDAPVYIDDNIPTNDNAGTPGGGTDDVAIAGLFDDVWLFTGPVRTNVYNEILSASLGVRFQLYGYAASLVRYGQSLAIASGTGFAAPTGTTASVLF